MMNANYQIRPARASDLENLLDYINTANQEPGIGIGSQGMIFSIEDEEKWLEQTLREVAAKKTVYLVVEAEDGRIVGSCDLRRFGEVYRHTGLFGLVIAKDFRGQGLGYELAQKVLAEAEQVMPDLKLIILDVFADNVAARRLYEKMGFKEYGLLPEGIIDAQHNLIDKVLMYKKVGEKK